MTPSCTGVNGEPEISETHVQRATEAARVIVLPPDRQILHNIPRTFVVDGQEGVRHPVGMAAQRLEVETHVVTGAATMVENVVRCVRKAGLTVEDVVLEPVASGQAVVTEAEKAIGCVLVDIDIRASCHAVSSAHRSLANHSFTSTIS